MLNASQALLDRSPNAPRSQKWKPWVAVSLLSTSLVALLAMHFQALPSVAGGPGSASEVLAAVDDFVEDGDRCEHANINYLGLAYDLAKGNASTVAYRTTMEGDVGDPGWKIRILFWRSALM